MESNPNAAFTGMYYQTRLLFHQKRWTDVLAMINSVKQKYPGRISPPDQARLDQMYQLALQQLSGGGAKQPPPKTSNK